VASLALVAITCRLVAAPASSGDHAVIETPVPA
jgi:hypothetical protein